MESPNTFLLRDTEAFMRGELDNVTVAGSRILLDMVQGAYVPYGCYTTPPIALPAFDALRASWNVDSPPGTAVEVQVRALVDGRWSAWSSFGRWSPYLPREGAAETVRGPLHLADDQLTLEGKAAEVAQLRIYLYTREEKATPSVRLLALSARALDTIPAGGRPVNARLRLLPYVVARRAPGLQNGMDLAICLASLTNRWGADLLPEELALVLRDHRPGAAANLSFAAAAVACWGFPAWAGWADLAALRDELRKGYGTVVALESTPARQEQGLPPLRYVTLRGIDGHDALLIDPWAGQTDFEAETRLPIDEFLVAWNGLALFMRPRHGMGEGSPARAPVILRADAQDPGLFRLYHNGREVPLPADFCQSGHMGGGILAWSVPDEHPHATTGHRRFHFVEPEAGGIRLPVDPQKRQRFTVCAIEPDGRMWVGDAAL